MTIETDLKMDEECVVLYNELKKEVKDPHKLDYLLREVQSSFASDLVDSAEEAYQEGYDDGYKEGSEDS